MTATLIDVERFQRQIARAPICEPGPGEYVDRCHFSKTGWGIWANESCTCRPARAPKS